MLFRWFPWLPSVVSAVGAGLVFTVFNAALGKTRTVQALQDGARAERVGRVHADSAFDARLTLHEAQMRLALDTVTTQLGTVHQTVSVLLVGQCSSHSRTELAYMMALVPFTCGPIRPRGAR
jgi:hypothetical protein